MRRPHYREGEVDMGYRPGEFLRSVPRVPAPARSSERTRRVKESPDLHGPGANRRSDPALDRETHYQYRRAVVRRPLPSPMPWLPRLLCNARHLERGRVLFGRADAPDACFWPPAGDPVSTSPRDLLPLCAPLASASELPTPPPPGGRCSRRPSAPAQSPMHAESNIPVYRRPLRAAAPRPPQPAAVALGSTLHPYHRRTDRPNNASAHPTLRRSDRLHL